jgi:hypothetical protein
MQQGQKPPDRPNSQNTLRSTRGGKNPNKSAKKMSTAIMQNFDRETTSNIHLEKQCGSTAHLLRKRYRVPTDAESDVPDRAAFSY